jgi:hypothetical protein
VTITLQLIRISFYTSKIFLEQSDHVQYTNIKISATLKNNFLQCSKIKFKKKKYQQKNDNFDDNIISLNYKFDCNNSLFILSYILRENKEFYIKFY